MDEIEFAEHRINASKAVTESDCFFMVTIKNGALTGNIQHSTVVEGLAMANYLKLYAKEIENNLFNNSESE